MTARRSGFDENRVELSLTDDHVLLAADAGVAKKFLYVEQSACRAVDGVVRVAVAKESSRNCHLRAFNGQATRGVVDGQGNFRRPRAADWPFP